MKPPEYYLLTRSYPASKEPPFVSVWLCARRAEASACLLAGEMLPGTLEGLVVALKGMRVQREESPYEGQPIHEKRLEEQRLLFPE